MGVPAFFRYLQQKYPLIISNCIEAYETNGKYSEDNTTQNPNTVGDRDFDNLYLDMNGIIHPCFHPEGLSPPKSEEEIFANIDAYVLRVFNIVRPRRVLFMAIDGSAPRAKMNQQRMRRYRAAKEAAHNRWMKIWEYRKEGNTAAADFMSQDDYLQSHDTNVITPGTPFMCRLADHLREFIKEQQEKDKAWRDIYIVLSDSSVPGEGEHKIMDFVRSQRVEPNYDPNTRHCIYGLDADLIFLGLASHEAYFTIIRENLIEQKEKPRQDSDMTDPDVASVVERNVVGPKMFHFVSLWILRQYLERDLKPTVPLPMPWDLDRAIDDFILFCFAAGNDFIPGLPGFSIRTKAIDTVIYRYKEFLPISGAYITFNGEVDLPRFRDLMLRMAMQEPRALRDIIIPSERSKEIEMSVNEVTTKEDPNISVEPPDKPPRDNNPIRRKQILSYKNKRIDQDTPLDELKNVYYDMKFGIQDVSGRSSVIVEYARGMMWTLKYYLHGCQSWGWYYPYHSAPCISDFNLLPIDARAFAFDPGRPYPPLWQLMAVLPPQSAHALPRVMAYLMTDDRSPLKEFYPTTFTVDLEGGTAAYKGHVLVPFIDGAKLEKVLMTEDLALLPDEQRRNSFGETLLFVSQERTPPVSHEAGKESIIINGPIFGQVVLPPGNDERGSTVELAYRLRIIPPQQMLSYLLRGAVMPEWAIEDRRTDTTQDVWWDKGAQNFDDIAEQRIMPLQMPGITPGSPWNFRERVIEIFHERSKLFGQN